MSKYSGLGQVSGETSKLHSSLFRLLHERSPTWSGSPPWLIANTPRKLRAEINPHHPPLTKINSSCHLLQILGLSKVLLQQQDWNFAWQFPKWKSQNHRIAERGHLAQSPCSEQGHLQLDQVAQSHIQPGLECFLHCFSGAFLDTTFRMRENFCLVLCLSFKLKGGNYTKKYWFEAKLHVSLHTCTHSIFVSQQVIV